MWLTGNITSIYYFRFCSSLFFWSLSGGFCPGSSFFSSPVCIQSDAWEKCTYVAFLPFPPDFNQSHSEPIQQIIILWYVFGDWLSATSMIEYSQFQLCRFQWMNNEHISKVIVSNNGSARFDSDLSVSTISILKLKNQYNIARWSLKWWNQFDWGNRLGEWTRQQQLVNIQLKRSN